MFEFIFDYVDKESFTKYLRLTVVVGFYLIFRQYYSKWAQSKAVKRQVDEDNIEKAEKPEKERLEKLAQQEELIKESKAFGWGKKTRNTVKLQQAQLEEQLSEVRERNQSSYDAQEDHDIEELLEDWVCIRTLFNAWNESCTCCFPSLRI